LFGHYNFRENQRELIEDTIHNLDMSEDEDGDEKSTGNRRKKGED